MMAVGLLFSQFFNSRILDEEMLRSTNSLGNSLSGAALYPAPLCVGGGGSLAPTISP